MSNYYSNVPLVGSYASRKSGGYEQQTIAPVKNQYALEQLMKKLRQRGILTHLSDSLLFQLLLYSDPIPERIVSGVILFQLEDLTSHWYLLISGEVQLFLPSFSSNNLYSGLAVETLAPGCLFGELHLTYHSCSARVRKTAEFIKINHNHFMSMYNKQADLLQPSLTIMQDLINELPPQHLEPTHLPEEGTSHQEDFPTLPADYYQHAKGNDYTINNPSTSSYNAFDCGQFQESLPPINSDFQPEEQLPIPRTDHINSDNEVWMNDGNVFEISNFINMESPIVEIALLLKRTMQLQAPQLLKERQFHNLVYSQAMFGNEITQWLYELAETCLSTAGSVPLNRTHIIGMWQALLEHHFISHITNELQFKDSHVLFRWTIEDPLEHYYANRQPPTDMQLTGINEMSDMLNEDLHITATQGLNDLHLKQALFFLSSIGPDAMFRMILRKTPQERSTDELQLVFSELMHIKALSHLSTMVKRELAAVIYFEQHAHAGTILFHQGDEGQSWYIILKGSVDVNIHGKGIVCTLHEGDDFGKLALVNDSPRAATIAVHEDHSQFLCIEKHDFNRILRDAESNTVRLNENGQDVLVLEKNSGGYRSKCIIGGGTYHQPTTNLPSSTQYCYSIMAGTPQKMLEYILETRIDAFAEDEPIDVFLEDFILTHIIYLPINLLCRYLKDYYIRKSYLPPRSDFRGLHPVEADIDIEQRVISKRRVVTFLGAWQLVMKNRLFLNKVANSFIEEINSCVLEDSQNLPNMQPILIKINKIRNIKENGMKRLHRKPLTVLAVGGIYTSEAPAPQPILPIDMCNQVFYSSDLTYITLSVCLEKSAYDIVQMVKPKFRFQDDQEQKFLVEVKSNGERVIFGQNEISISTMLPQNSRLYIVNKEEVENLSPTIDQTLNNWDNTGYVSLLERLRCSEIATQLTQFHNQLFEATEEIELVIQVLGKNLFPDQTCSNLDLLMRRFNEIQFWCTTEILMARGCAKRTETLKKFIKIANYCKDSNDLLSLFAITLSLSSAPISRLNSLWKSVPQKFIRQYNEFESLLDPSRNHRSYRMFIAKLSPPIIPFIPLILKDLTFINEGNKTYFTGLVNFEKMHMIADGLRTFRNCKASSLGYITAIKKPEIMYLVKNFLVIDNSKKLMELSYQIERPRRIVKDY